MAERIITRTVYGASIQTVKQLGLSHVILDYTTINQAINEKTIVKQLPDIRQRGMETTEDYDYATDTDKIYTEWLVIGNGGHEVVNNPNDAVPYTYPVPHRATDSGLFNIMPFLIRPIDSDLTQAERKDYGLRRTLEVEGVLYAAYFARRLNFPRSTPDMTITTIVNGVPVTEQFVPTIENLRPAKYGPEVNYEGQYASVSSQTTVVWTAKQIQDLRDACRVLFGNERMAIISELAVCSGVEKMVVERYPSGAGAVMNPIPVPPNMFFDVAACQVNSHITTFVPIAFIDSEYSLTLNLGATEPLFGKNVVVSP